MIIYPDTVGSMDLQLVTHGSAVWGRNPRLSDSSFILPCINHWKGQFDGLSRDPLLAIEVPDGAPLMIIQKRRTFQHREQQIVTFAGYI